MMKTRRAFLVILLLVAAASASVEARDLFAIGGEGSLYLQGNGGLPMSAMLTFHIPQVPLMFAIGVRNPLAIAATADYWAAHGSLSRVFAWYAGVGGYLFVDTSSEGTVEAGGRIPLGLQAWPVGKVLELFLEVAPAVGVILVPTGFEWHLQGALGLRFWL